MRSKQSPWLALALTAGMAASSLSGLASSAEPPVISMEAVRNDRTAPVFQPAGYDATVIVYSDYRCPYCRRAHAVLEQLVKADGKVRIVYRDWPVFGGVSVEAARHAIASQWQDRHAAFNAALMETDGELTDEGIREAADKAGIDWARLQSDLTTRGPEIDGLLERTELQATALGLQGTPGFLIGDNLVPGGLELTDMIELVAAARAGTSSAASQ